MLFKKSDVKDLTDKLQELCNNEELVNKLRDGVDEFILGKYNWNDVADTTKGLYEKVLKKHRKGNKKEWMNLQNQRKI